MTRVNLLFGKDLNNLGGHSTALGRDRDEGSGIDAGERWLEGQQEGQGPIEEYHDADTHARLRLGLLQTQGGYRVELSG